MNQAIIPPRQPQPPPLRPPMIYVETRIKWEYKQVIRHLEKESPPYKTELNELGTEGWEMTGVAQQPPLAYFYFKRVVA